MQLCAFSDSFLTESGGGAQHKHLSNTYFTSHTFKLHCLNFNNFWVTSHNIFLKRSKQSWKLWEYVINLWFHITVSIFFFNIASRILFFYISNSCLVYIFKGNCHSIKQTCKDLQEFVYRNRIIYTICLIKQNMVVNIDFKHND